MTEPSGSVEAVGLLSCPNPWCEAAEREGDFSPDVRSGALGVWSVCCTSCGTKGPYRTSDIQAMSAWNTRPTPSDQEKLEGWQPIETAPKDGTEILILAHGMCIQARFEPGSWSSDTPIAPAEYDGAVWCGFDDQVNFEIEETDHGNFHGPVTHWMPLPALPSDQKRISEAYVVWSNEHAAWWGRDRCGYTRVLANAGRYSRAEALSIAGARDGGWHVRKGNPDEIAMPERDAIDQYADITRSQEADARPERSSK